MRSLAVVLCAAFLLAACRSGADQAPADAGAAGTGESLSGTVLERIDVPTYTYLRIGTSTGEVWAAVPTARVDTGSRVTVRGAMPMNNFESKSINRRFPVIYFGQLDAAAGPAAVANPHGSAGKSAVEVAAGTVEKAGGADARSVAEVWMQKASLREKPVLVRGRIVKFNGGIMGRNWVHLQDGTGDPASGTHDITVTTQETVSVGEVVTFKGIVRVDKDFGAGYTYACILEDGALQK